MTKIYESDFNGWDERAEAIIVHELDEGDYEKLCELRDEEGVEALLESLGYYSQDSPVMPGARYTMYYLESLTVHHLVISRVDALNV